MREVVIAMAKLAGIHKALHSALNEDISRSRNGKDRLFAQNFDPEKVGHYFTQANAQLEILKRCMPDWFGDFHALPLIPETKMAIGFSGDEVLHFSRGQMERLSRDIDEVFEIRANSEHTNKFVESGPRRVFISHGRAKDWYEVQGHIEKDLGLETLELAQEPSLGQTVIEKLEINATLCDVAVIVMSGDDTDDAGKARTRENVMHETGYFQARYGRNRVVLLHEEGVNVPSNLGGIVYVPYPKAMPGASFGALDRELKAIYKI
jgi:predicted nucleotide-binding protein